MQPRRTGALIGAALLTLAACGTGSDDAAAPAVDEQPAPADDATDAGSADTAAPATEASDVGEPATESATEPAAEPATDDGADAETDGEPAEEAAPDPEEAAEPAATEAPEPAPAEPVVGGRLFAADVQPDAQFDGNPFPDLVVDDVGKDAQVNVANILPSDRPVLLWAWAPH